MANKTVDILFANMLKRFKKWLEKAPTGKFIVEINVNQGGLRGKPKVSITEDV